MRALMISNEDALLSNVLSPGSQSDGFFWVRARVAVPAGITGPLAIQSQTLEATPNLPLLATTEINRSLRRHFVGRLRLSQSCGLVAALADLSAASAEFGSTAKLLR